MNVFASDIDSNTDNYTSEIIRTTCAYCGVGCGILAEVNKNSREVTVKGDPDHPANYGKLCSKGAALAETLSPDSRLLHPEVDGKRSDWATALDAVARKFSSVIRQHGPDAVAIYGSGQLLTEDYYVANKLMKGFIGSANIDTNSRLCMASAVAGYKRAFGSDTVPCSYEDLECAELIIMIGSNAAWCHPVIFGRIRRAKEENPDLKVVVIDPRRTDSCDIADLHLAIKPGTDVLLFNGLLNFLFQNNALNKIFINSYTQGFEVSLRSAQQDAGDFKAVADQCGIQHDDLLTFYHLYKNTEKTISFYSQGVNQSSQGVDKVNSISTLR